jgi:hypothetical protein
MHGDSLAHTYDQKTLQWDKVNTCQAMDKEVEIVLDPNKVMGRKSNYIFIFSKSVIPPKLNTK